jgi:hypothetical protein
MHIKDFIPKNNIFLAPMAGELIRLLGLYADSMDAGLSILKW